MFLAKSDNSLLCFCALRHELNREHIVSFLTGGLSHRLYFFAQILAGKKNTRQRLYMASRCRFSESLKNRQLELFSGRQTLLYLRIVAKHALVQSAVNHGALSDSKQVSAPRFHLLPASSLVDSLMSVRRFVGESDEEHNPALIQRIYGPLELGAFFAMILYGVLLVQIYSYYMTYKSDQRKVKYLVFYLLIVETIHSALVMGMVYQPLVLDFGRVSVFHYFPRLLPSEAILTVCISAPIQVLVAWRLWNIQQSIWIAAIVVVLSAVSTTGGLWTGVQVAMLRVYEKSPQAYPAIYMWLGSAAAADMLITASLSCILYRRRTGSPASDAVLTRIIRFTIQNGLVTSIAAILDIVLLVAFPNISINWIFEVALVKLYANTLMSTLNSRQSLNKQWNNHESLMFNQRLDILDTPQNTDIVHQSVGMGILASRAGQIKSITNAAGMHLQQSGGLKIELKQEV